MLHRVDAGASSVPRSNSCCIDAVSRQAWHASTHHRHARVPIHHRRPQAPGIIPPPCRSISTLKKQTMCVSARRGVASCKSGVSTTVWSAVTWYGYRSGPTANAHFERPPSTVHRYFVTPKFLAFATVYVLQLRCSKVVPSVATVCRLFMDVSVGVGDYHVRGVVVVWCGTGQLTRLHGVRPVL